MSEQYERRDFFRVGAAAAAGLAAAGVLGGGPSASAQEGSGPATADAPAAPEPDALSRLASQCFEESGRAKLPPLAYGYGDLEPHIDAETMRLHHDLHHAGYVQGFNRALDDLARARDTGDFGTLDHYSRKLAFHGAGHALHCLFWDIMRPGGGGAPQGALAKAIERDFGSFGQFQAHFSAAAKSVEGSGWAILAIHLATGRLMIHQALNHQNLTQWTLAPLLPLDVWEHAYYLRYQNRRADYINAFWNVVAWDRVAAHYAVHAPAPALGSPAKGNP